jgi:hypothetical protein
MVFAVTLYTDRPRSTGIATPVMYPARSGAKKCVRVRYVRRKAHLSPERNLPVAFDDGLYA